VLTTVEHFRRIQERFWPNPEGAARKFAISASLVVEYALHVLPPRSMNWQIFAAAQPIANPSLRPNTFLLGGSAAESVALMPVTAQTSTKRRS
jgi:hypothetical protein